jgi:subtilisin-like proprotein convertase family protein
VLPHFKSSLQNEADIWLDQPIFNMSSIVLLFVTAFTIVLGNTEKVIFLGPSSLQIPVEHPTLEDLRLDTLSPQHWALRTHLQAEFPTDSSKYGHASWFILHRLDEGKRYEVRVCWAATVSNGLKLGYSTI